MENLIKYFDTIETGFKKMKIITFSSLALCAVIAIGSVVCACYFMLTSVSAVYVIDKGQTQTATLSSDDSQKELEVQDHLVRFHELLFNLSPSAEAIRSNLDRALLMSDRTAYNYSQDLAEKGFYNRLISANISQQFQLDSLKTNMRKYPYQCALYGKLYLLRESNITSYQLQTICQMVETGRSKDNPHGLMIERFEVVMNDKIGTRKRN